MSQDGSGKSQPWLCREEWGREPEQGLGFGSAARVFSPSQEQRPRELVDLSVDGFGAARIPSFSERWEGEVRGDELRAPLCVPCSAPPKIPQHPWARTPQIPARSCHGRWPRSSNIPRVLLPPDWDEPEAAEKAP